MKHSMFYVHVDVSVVARILEKGCVAERNSVRYNSVHYNVEARERDLYRI